MDCALLWCQAQAQSFVQEQCCFDNSAAPHLPTSQYTSACLKTRHTLVSMFPSMFGSHISTQTYGPTLVSLLPSMLSSLSAEHVRTSAGMEVSRLWSAARTCSKVATWKH